MNVSVVANKIPHTWIVFITAVVITITATIILVIMIGVLVLPWVNPDCKSHHGT
jgi:hypothetical protein